MPSRLRFQQEFDPITTGTIRPQFKSSQPPQKKQKMSLTHVYYIASSARAKLGKEACKPDHNLRLLVGHANLLDALMLDLHDAEREQEAWFNQTVQKAQKAEEPKHIQWADTIVEEEESESEDDASDSDSEFDEDEFEMQLSLKRVRSAPVAFSSEEMDEDDEEYYDEEEESSELALTRTQSRSSQSPPELVDDSDSEDDSPPASPPQISLDLEMFDEKNSSTLSESEQAAFFDDGYFIPERTAPMIAAC